MDLCLCLSQVEVQLKRLNTGSHKQHNTIAQQGLYFSGAKYLREIRPGSPRAGAPNASAVGQNRRLPTNNQLLSRQKAQLSPSDRAMRFVSSNLANCHATVQKLLIGPTTSPDQTDGTKLEV